MTNIGLYSSIALLIFASACQQKDVYYNIDSSTKILFKQGDTLLFNSALRTDTFKIDQLIDDFTISDKMYHREYISVYYQKLHYTQSIDSIFRDGSYNIQRTSTATNIAWRNLYGDPGNSYYSKTDTIIQIANRTITNVQYLASYSNVKHALNDVVKVFSCDLYGIIEYDRYDGEKFILDSKSFNKYIK
jgi:hypothetical protein